MLRQWLRAIFPVVLLSAAGSLCQGRPYLRQQPQSPPSAPQAPPQKSAPTAAGADVHKNDAYNAEKDIDVATFYMHKGDIDAAIPRLEEAAKLRPNYGRPRLLLADCYEKKHDPTNAVRYYKEYLKVYPDAPDAKKIQKKIEKLEGQQ
ncbi:MAG TPA: tetratricopeptide repeat protein [Candidatus Cybelea sp.]|nr:tetratricopeptide repeat protein [Candidatus Cybelea sp.]